VIVGQVNNNQKPSQDSQDTVNMQTSNNAVQNPNGNTTVRVPVQTGDTTMIIPFVILVGVAAIAILLVIILKKNRK
ncbi:MAG: LPXTG cell wall anchor domain-containing protein, partial [Lachnospiraceae bacterium]|nr:LPXTG cell wall anchor domain-containing protein [Lachnospiraceae bacterium]